MEPLYKPEGVEVRWQRTWEDEGLYRAYADDPRPTFVDAHPPPNVTGELHTGHALQLALGDAIVRMKRMQGFNVLFQPGYDHAGISTQNAVEKHLATEGRTRQELGREAFEALVWDWLREYGGTIMTQFRRMGASLDYSRERMTLDPAYTRAVMRFFVHLYRKGWIFRANRIINWCPYHETSLSDLELVHADVDDTLTTIRYPLADGSGFIPIATVRPATIPGDVAVAVHPDDDRYRDLVGKEAIVPFVERRVPIIADERVEPEFGTGALKITPGHDPKDFEIGRDHELPEPMVIGPDGRMNDAVPGARRPDAEGGRGADPRLVPRARPDRRARALPPLGRALRALRDPHRAADLAPVVVQDGGAEAACARGAARAACPVPPGVAAPLRDRLARERARLVHLAPDLVGPPAASLGVPGRAHHVRRGGAARPARSAARRS